MALINCEECGKEISAKAENCPHCGYKKEKSSGCLPIIIIGAIVIGAITSLSSNNSNNTTTSAPIDLKQSASGACMEFIKQVLHDPDSAEFGDSSSAYVNEEISGNWVVQREVRAKNAFNAVRLSNFECKMTFDGNNWRASSVKESH
jgi:hypothetical protein